MSKASAPFWVKSCASMASVVMLLAISSYNVVPTIKRATDGDHAAIGLAAVQIAFTIILAVLPFVPGWRADTRNFLTIAFMLGNGYFAFEIAGHRHDVERTARNQHDAIVAELNDKRDELKRIAIGDFTSTESYQVEIARDAARAADAEKAATANAINAIRAQIVACAGARKCAALNAEASRLEEQAKRKDDEAKSARETLNKVSGWHTLTKQAAPINARIEEIQKVLNSEKFVADTASSSETGRTFEAALIALLIELGNRFGPEAIFKFLFFAAGVSIGVAAAERSDPVNALAAAYPRREPCAEPPVSGAKPPSVPLERGLDDAARTFERKEAYAPPRRASLAVAKLKQDASATKLTMDDLIISARDSLPCGEYTIPEITRECQRIADRIVAKNPRAKVPREIAASSQRIVKHGAVRATEPGKRPSSGDRLTRYKFGNCLPDEAESGDKVAPIRQPA